MTHEVKTSENREAVRVVCELLRAGDWLAKCAVIGREAPFLPAVRAILRDEARLCEKRGDQDDADIYAAHVALLDDIKRRGLASAQAEIIGAMAFLAQSPRPVSPPE